jgi:hypothetical protein
LDETIDKDGSAVIEVEFVRGGADGGFVLSPAGREEVVPSGTKKVFESVPGK